MLHDREAEPRAARGARAVGAVEALEQARQVGLVDPGPVVDDPQDDRAVLAPDRERRVRPRARRSGSRSRPGSARRRAASAAAPRRSRPRRPRRAARRRRARPAPRARPRPRRSTGSTGSAPSETTRVPDSSSARKSTSSISSRIWSTSRARLLDELGDVLARQRGELEQREQPRERRPQLVRDRSREARAQLLVRGQVAGLGEIDEPLRRGRRPCTARRARARSASSSAARAPPPPARRAPGAPAGSPRRTIPPSSSTTTASRLSSSSTWPRTASGFTTPLPLLHPAITTFRACMMHAVAKVLIIEDDDVIAQGMARHLTAAGFDAVGVANGETGLARLRYEQPDVCVLDLMLPGVDGWRVIEQARGEGIGTPIVVVSARGTEHDRVNALELGADDYLVKPFSMKELAARVAAAARRGTRAQEPRRGDEINVEELRLDPRNVQAYVDGESAEPDADRVPAPLRARARPGPRAHPRRAAPARLGPPRLAPRPHRRRLRPQAAREGRPARLGAHLHPDALRRRLQARGRARRSLLSRRRRGSRASRAGCSRRRAGSARARGRCGSAPEVSSASTSKPASSSASRASVSARPVDVRHACPACGFAPSETFSWTVSPRFSSVPAGWACATILPAALADGT